MTPAAQPTSGGRPSGMRVREKPKRVLPRRFLCKGRREPVSAPARLYAAICFLVTAAFFAAFLGAASGLAAVGFVVSAFFAVGFFLGW